MNKMHRPMKVCRKSGRPTIYIRKRPHFDNTVGQFAPEFVALQDHPSTSFRSQQAFTCSRHIMNIVSQLPFICLFVSLDTPIS